MATDFQAHRPRPVRSPKKRGTAPATAVASVSLVRTAPSRKIFPSTETRDFAFEEGAGVVSILAGRAATVGAVGSGSVALRLADEVGEFAAGGAVGGIQ